MPQTPLSERLGTALSQAKFVRPGLSVNLTDGLDWREVDAALGAVMSVLSAEGMAHEVCICAAELLDDGRIIRGHRHNDCHRTMLGMTPRPSAGTQGFMTTRNRFVDRQVGLQLQLEARVPSVRGFYQNELYSEDLY
jgi:hypothetical protein